jgi:AraC-like DNA-binding protein
MIYSISELLSYYGGLLGIILSIVLFTRSSGKSSVRISLAFYLITGSIMIILGAINYSGKIVSLPHLLRLDSPVHYLFPPLGFFFVYSVFNPDFRFRWIYLLNFVPFVVNLAEFTPFYIQNAGYKIDYYNSYIASMGSISMPVHYFMKSILGFVYLVLQFYVFLKYKPKLSNRKKSMRSIVPWFWLFLSAEAIMIAGLLFDNLTAHKFFVDPYRFSIGMVTFFIYNIILALLFSPQMLYGNENKETVNETIIARDKYMRSKLSGEEKEVILEKFCLYLKSETKPFLNPRMALQEVSSLLEVSANNLSQVINEKTGFNFNDYINTFRVEEAKNILTSPEYQKLTIEAIAEKAGFNSKSPFYTAFKKHTGMTPKEFAAMQLHVLKEND